MELWPQDEALGDQETKENAASEADPGLKVSVQIYVDKLISVCLELFLVLALESSISQEPSQFWVNLDGLSS